MPALLLRRAVTYPRDLLADRVLIVNPGGYLGQSTRRELAYAQAAGKPIAFTDPL